jgi:hypothetical protein
MPDDSFLDVTIPPDGIPDGMEVTQSSCPAPAFQNISKPSSGSGAAVTAF